jgi:hypothetical protein
VDIDLSFFSNTFDVTLKGAAEGPPAWRLTRVVWAAPVGGGHYCVGALFDKPLSGPTLQALTSA